MSGEAPRASDLDARSIFLKVSGLQLHARVRGPDSAPPTLLLHGWLDHCGSFDLLADALHASAALRHEPLRTVALDFRGHGDSSWVGAGGFYHLAEHVADLEGVLDGLGVGAPGGPASARIVGHSLGGAVGLLYAAVRPARVAHLSMLDSFPLTVKASEVPDRLSEYLNDVKRPRARRTVASIAFAAERMKKVNPRLTDEVALHLAAGGTSPDPLQGHQLAWKWDPLLRGHSPLPFMEVHLRELLPLVTAPVFALRAGDTFLPEEDELRQKLSGVKGAVTIETLAGTGHHLHLDQPREVAARVEAAWARALQSRA